MSPFINTTTFNRRRFLHVGAAAIGAALLPRVAEAAISTTDLGGVTLFIGAGANILAMAGPNGALMIDGGLAANADALLAAVKTATRTTRINTLIDTHWHPEQTGANAAVGRAGGVIIAHEKTKTMVSHTVYGANGFKQRVPALPKDAQPNKTVRSDGTMEFAGVMIDYGYMPAAHTDGDIYVHFPSLNVLAAGGVASAEGWPSLDYKNGAWLGGRVRAFEHLADIVNPDTRVVPSNGRVMTGAEIVRQRDMYQQLFKTMIGYLNMGLGPEDMKAKRPLKDYEAELGDSSAFAYDALKSMMIAYVPD